MHPSGFLHLHPDLHSKIWSTAMWTNRMNWTNNSVLHGFSHSQSFWWMMFWISTRWENLASNRCIDKHPDKLTNLKLVLLKLPSFFQASDLLMGPKWRVTKKKSPFSRSQIKQSPSPVTGKFQPGPLQLHRWSNQHLGEFRTAEVRNVPFKKKNVRNEIRNLGWLVGWLVGYRFKGRDFFFKFGKIVILNGRNFCFGPVSEVWICFCWCSNGWKLWTQTSAPKAFRMGREFALTCFSQSSNRCLYPSIQSAININQVFCFNLRASKLQISQQKRTISWIFDLVLTPKKISGKP